LDNGAAPVCFSLLVVAVWKVFVTWSLAEMRSHHEYVPNLSIYQKRAKIFWGLSNCRRMVANRSIRRTVARNIALKSFNGSARAKLPRLAELRSQKNFVGFPSVAAMMVKKYGRP
jgi:hypothetical protein